MTEKKEDAMENKPIIILPIRPGHVLVADDEPRSRRLLKDLLTAKGHRITEAGDGEETLAAIRRDRPDVVLLDVMMPKMDGFEVCRRLKSDPATALIHVLMITSLTEREHRLKGIECGANDFLTKPVESEEVLLRVRNAVMARQDVAELQKMRAIETSENTVLCRLRDLAVSDSNLALALLTVGAELLAWSLTTRQLDPAARDRLYAIYEQLSAALAKSGAAPS